MKVLGNIIKSKSDNQSYKAFMLPNKMRCLVISDKDAQKSAAALSVSVGALQDPIEAQGLAHYLEHMLFMGTEKYPRESDYQQFINKHAGHTNAYTDANSTNYYFDIVNNKFNEALDRFAQFFISPLMSASSSERELSAVHSEHCKNLLNDMRKKFQLGKQIAKQGHPYRKFQTGDKNTLGKNKNLRELLVKFYNQHYSSNIMNLVVYGKESPDNLIKLIEKHFSAVENKQKSKCIMEQCPYDDTAMNKFVKMVPNKDIKRIDVWWILNNKAPHYRNDPGTYFAHLIGHEGKGSLLDSLMSQGLATQLTAGSANYYSCFTKFNITITLTKAGISDLQSILNKVFGYLCMLKQKGPQERVFKEIQKGQKMRFDYQVKKFGANYCVQLANELHDVENIEQILNHYYLFEKYDPELLKSYLDELLNIKNTIIFTTGKIHEPFCDKFEPIYSTKYAIHELPEICPENSDLDIPGENVFIPETLQVIKPLGTDTVPTRIFHNEQYEVFYKRDHRFGLPRTRVELMLYYNGVNSPQQLVARTLFNDMFKKDVKDLSYNAEIAEIQTYLCLYTYDIDVTIAGFSDSVSKYVKPYLQHLKNYQPNKDSESDRILFDTLKEKLVRNYKNYFLSPPYERAGNLRTRSLREGAQTKPTEKLEAAEKITFDDVIAFGQKWKRQLYAELYISGNLKAEQAEAMMKDIQSVFQDSKVLPKQSIGEVKAVKLEPHKIVGIHQQIANPAEQNSCVIVHFQYDKWDIKTSIMKSLCMAFIREPAFDYLRTKEQLGYIVAAIGEQHRGMLGVSFMVQSNVKASYEIVEYVDKFLKTYLRKKIQQLDEEDFEQIKKSLLSSKKEKDKKLAQESLRFWDEIITHKYNFHRKEEEIKFLPSVTLQQFKEFLELIFYKAPCRLEVHMTSPKEEFRTRNKEALERRLANDGNYIEYKDYRDFKKTAKLLPDLYSHL